MGGGTLSGISLSIFVCNALAFQSLDLESSFLACRYIFTGHGSKLYIKVIGSRSRSQERRKRVGVSQILQTEADKSWQLPSYVHKVVYMMLNAPLMMVVTDREWQTWGGKAYKHLPCMRTVCLPLTLVLLLTSLLLLPHIIIINVQLFLNMKPMTIGMTDLSTLT